MGLAVPAGIEVIEASSTALEVRILLCLLAQDEVLASMMS
jgi:hypothetical protein